MKTYFRRLNPMFHIDDEGYLVKTSNGERVPDDEPLFILRGRDAVAADTLYHYGRLMIDARCDDLRIFEVGLVTGSFYKFRAEHPGRMKQPGSTKGK